MVLKGYIDFITKVLYILSNKHLLKSYMKSEGLI